MVDIDEIPEPEQGVSRRSFVKGSLLAAAGVAAAGSVGALVNSSFITRDAPVRRLHYIGNTLVSGPAPQGLPLIPLKVEDGVVLGDPDFGSDDPEWSARIGSVLDWYKFCGHEDTPGLSSTFRSDNHLKYFLLPEKIASTQSAGIELWYRDRIGEDIRVDDFRDVGYGAGFRWRSEGQTGKNIITGIVMRMRRRALAYTPGPWPLGPEHFERAAEGMYVDLGDGTVLMACISFCKHFCCVPGWQESPLARTQGFWSKVFCTCHFSVYDPVLVKGDYFIGESAAPGGGDAGGH
ncbi:MAG TPA: twin-arginine translocation signal domain-containing protein [Candidatus Thermoplasmatota archaeon]|nr:twin-arginine translocation signal domain-containing protein [Candidatus Thermoplasmatota archaeon]